MLHVIGLLEPGHIHDTENTALIPGPRLPAAGFEGIVPPFDLNMRHAMTTITILSAQSDLPGLVKRAFAGEEIVIEADDRCVRLLPVSAQPEFDAETARKRGFGVLKGKLSTGPEFFEPLSDAECGLASSGTGGI